MDVVTHFNIPNGMVHDSMVFSGWRFKSWKVANHAFKSFTVIKGIYEGETNHTVFLNNNSNGNTQHSNIFCVNTSRETLD